MLCNLTRETGTESGKRRPRTVGKAKHGYRCLDRPRGDVDDATETAFDHRIDQRLDEVEGCQHVRIKRLDPGLTGPVTEITGRRSTGIVDQDIHLARRVDHCRAAFRRGYVACHLGDRDAVLCANTVSRRGQRFGGARIHHQIDANRRQRISTSKAKSLARRAYDRGLS